MNPIPNHCIECDKPTMYTLCDRCKEKEMGKVKGMLEEDMIKHPELYDGSTDYEFWIQSRKEKLLEKKGKKKSHKQKGKK